MMHKIVTVIGARPQFIKSAPLRKAFGKDDNFQEILIHTGQHYDQNMSGIFFDQLQIREPEYSLNNTASSHGAMTGEMMAGIEIILKNEEPDAVLVFGDTNSTLAGALSAAKLHIPVFHVEAGLRSFNKKMPEEINRILTDHISDLLFCSTSMAIKNLKQENITKGVSHVGDIMYDSTLDAMILSKDLSLPENIDLTRDNIALCTIHRAENTQDPGQLSKIVSYVQNFARDYHIILPIHPRLKNCIQDYHISLNGIQLIEPLGYLEMQKFLSASKLILTDSGGLQKEAYFHKTPCITLRDETEWVETIENGWNRLWKNETYRSRKTINEYGDGKTA